MAGHKKLKHIWQMFFLSSVTHCGSSIFTSGFRGVSIKRNKFCIEWTGQATSQIHCSALCLVQSTASSTRGTCAPTIGYNEDASSCICGSMYKCLEPSASSDETYIPLMTNLDCELVCPVGWSYNEVTDKCYIYSQTQLNFVDAVENCKSIAGDEFEDANLASIHSEEEFLFIQALKTVLGFVWIGFNDMDTEETYVWTDGTPMDYTKKVQYEPTGSINENCGMAFTSGRGYGFYDHPCDDNIHSFCKCSPLKI